MFTRHGHNNINSAAHRTWNGMKQRCRNPNNHKYPAYGGRGIDYAPEWEDFETFLADMGEPPKGMSLDRIDNDGPYSRDNCRWATPTQQQHNRGICVTYRYADRDWRLAELEAHLGIGKHTLKYRLKQGWPDWRVAMPPTKGKADAPPSADSQGR